MEYNKRYILRVNLKEKLDEPGGGLSNRQQGFLPLATIPPKLATIPPGSRKAVVPAIPPDSRKGVTARRMRKIYRFEIKDGR